jgi:squalene synthase HpnC
VCELLARTHYENFPVASRLLPRPMRPHIAAIYAFARTADDFADEGHLADAERLAKLDDWGRKLREPGDHPIFVALTDTITRCDLDIALFDDLLSAFRQDVTTKRYATWTDLLDYCRRSANPVGRLVLRIAGYRSHQLDQQSDAVCTALQLTNFWQDVERDRAIGRDYLPEDLKAQHGAGALEAAGAKTRELFRQGRGVSDAVTGRLRWELRATWLGGMRILEKLEASRFDPRFGRPTLGLSDAVRIGWRMLTWQSGAQGPPRPKND